MAFNELTQPYSAYTVIHPTLSNQQEPSQTIFHDAADVSTFDRVQQRMKIIISFALIAIILGIVFLVPRGLLTTQAAAGQQSVAVENVASNVATASGISPVFSREVRYWETEIMNWSAQYGVDPNLVATIMQIESCGDPQAVSGAGAQGLFQVMPFHFVDGEDMLHPDTNASRGIAYFVERMAQTNGNIGLAFAGYNGGHVAAAGGWDDWVPETQRYFVWATGIYNDIEAGLTESPTLREWMAAGGVSLCHQASTRLGLR